MEDIRDYTLKDLEEFFIRQQYPKFYASQVFGWIYKHHREDFNLMSNISQEARRILRKNFYFSRLNLLKQEISSDGTEKFLFGLKEGSSIETVAIPEGRRRTLCISTQVGCKFGCKFCLSGKAGFVRNLQTSEIINQYLAAANLRGRDKITNIVFMGIGEPLDNFYNTVKAIKIFTEPKGLYLGRRRICLSTCGLIPQIKRLEELNLGIRLSISLHSPVESIRSEIMPINKKYSLKELARVIKKLSREQRYHITLEYILIKGLNTSKRDAHKLSRLLRGTNCKINLIPLSCSLNRLAPPGKEEIEAFREELNRGKILSTLRKSRGSDINAACGQLRAKCPPVSALGNERK